MAGCAGQAAAGPQAAPATAAAAVRPSPAELCKEEIEVQLSSDVQAMGEGYPAGADATGMEQQYGPDSAVWQAYVAAKSVLVEGAATEGVSASLAQVLPQLQGLCTEYGA
jgi:hypothetical protein